MAGIRVTGIDNALTSEKELTIYFSKRKNGGGDIKQIYFPLINYDAVIIYKDENVVDTILSFDKHILQGVQVSVSRLPPMVFSEVEAKLEADYSSVVLATDIKDELEFWARIQIIQKEQGTCVLHGNWYQIERAWQIINRAWNRQQKIQYKLQQQLSVNKDSPGSRRNPYEQLSDHDVTTDTPVVKKSALEPRPTNRKMQESYMTVVDPDENMTDSIISQTPFENSVFDEVRRMQMSEDDGGSLYSSHKYPLPQTPATESSSRSTKRGTSESDRIKMSLRSDSATGYTDSREQHINSTGSPFNENQVHSLPAALNGARYDELFTPVNVVNPGHNRNPADVNEQQDNLPQNVYTSGSKTYTVTREANYNSNQFDSEEESVTPNRSLLDAVHMNSDSDSETELKSSSTVGAMYQHHRYEDQNNTFNKFSEQNKEDRSSVERYHSLPVTSTEPIGMDNYRLVRDRKIESHDLSTSNGMDAGTHIHGSHESRSLGFSNSMSRSQRMDFRGSTENGPEITGHDLSSSRRGMENSQNDLPLSARSKFKDASDTYSFGYGTQLTPITSSSELLALGHVEEGMDDVSRYEFQIGKLKILVYKGDITKATTRGLVNAANGYLANGAGVAGAIAMAAGQSMQRECQKIIQREGMLDTGSVVHTTAGGKLDRNVTYILHAVGPIWIEALKSRCNFEMIVTYLNCFKYASKIWLDSLTLPCISSGIFGCPLDMSVQSFLDALLLFNCDLEDNNHLEEVHLVNNDLEGVMTTIGLIKSVMENGVDHATAQALNRFNMLEKSHSKHLGERLSKTFTKRMQTKDDIADTRSSRNTSSAPRRSSSLNRLPKKKENGDTYDRTLTRNSGSSSQLSELSASKISLRDKSVGESPTHGTRTGRDMTRRENSGSLSARSSASNRPYSSSYSDIHSSSSSRLTNGTHSIRDSSSTALTSGSGSTTLDELDLSSSYSSVRSVNSGKKKQSVSDRLYAQPTQASCSRIAADLSGSTKKQPPHLKQALMSSSGGAKPKTTSTYHSSRNAPMKATGSSAYKDYTGGDSYRSKPNMHDFDGTASLPLARISTKHTRGSSPRR